VIEMFENYYLLKEIRKAKHKRKECEFWLKVIDRIERMYK